MKFYTNVNVYGSKILYRGVENGRRIRHKIDYHPTLFTPSQKPTKYTTIHGEYVDKINPGSIRDCRDFVKMYEDVQGFKIYGNQRYEYSYISDSFPGVVDWDMDHINVCNIDIEVGSENGFPEPEVASEPITAITMKMSNGKFIVLGCGDFNNIRDDVRYVKCRDEIDLMKRFIDEWSGDYPDIITGWNVKLFDMTYLVNRIKKMLGEEWAKRLSPWGVINEREIVWYGKTQKAYTFLGIAIYDYIELYRKYAPDGNSQESYKLDYIAQVEVGVRKIAFDGNLHTLYKDNYQKFIEYNIRDVELVEKLEDKLKLIELALTLSYDSKTNYDDVFTQVRMWDILIYNHLREKNMVIPPNERHSKDAAYVGAYVKDPIIGKHDWVASFDLNSLYPHLIMQYNISPEMLIDPSDYDSTHYSILSHNVNVDSLLERKIDTSGLRDCTLTPNGQFFRTTEQGFLPKMMAEMYDARTIYKKKAEAKVAELVEAETAPEKAKLNASAATAFMGKIS